MSRSTSHGAKARGHVDSTGQIALVDSGMELSAIRRELRAIHADFRNQGQNPMEALVSITEGIVGGSNAVAKSRVSDLANRAQSASLLASAFQGFISDDLRSAFGQYLTPPEVAEHVADLLLEHSHQEPGSVLDPFGGTGILLDAVGRRVPNAQYRAIEINRAIAPVCEAMAALQGFPFEVVVGDALVLWTKGHIGQVDAVVMNPPFGASLATVPVKDLVAAGASPALLSQARSPVELVALEIAAASVVDGGVFVSVLPLSVLTNQNLAQFRADFFTRNRILHVTKLPEETFSPFRGVASSCVLVCRRKSSALPAAFTVRISKSVGYDNTGRLLGKNDLVNAPAVSEAGSVGKLGEVRIGAAKHALIDGYALGEIATIFRGANPARDQYQEDGPFLLKVGSLSGSFVSWRTRDRSYVPQTWFDRLGTKRLRVGDVCFTATAHKPHYIALKVDLIDQLPDCGAAPSAEVIVIRLKEDSPVTPVEMLYFLRTTDGRESIQSLVKGSTAHVYPKDLAGMVIPKSALPADRVGLEEAHGAAARAYREYLRLEAVAGQVASTDLSDQQSG